MHCPHRLHLFESVSTITFSCSLTAERLIIHITIQHREKSPQKKYGIQHLSVKAAFLFPKKHLTFKAGGVYATEG